MIYWTLGNFLKPLATINLPKSPKFLGIFCKGVKIDHFSREIILANFYRHLAIFFWSHWLSLPLRGSVVPFIIFPTRSSITHQLCFLESLFLAEKKVAVNSLIVEHTTYFLIVLLLYLFHNLRFYQLFFSFVYISRYVTCNLRL